MTVAFYTNIISPHFLPLAREIVRQIGASNFRYIYTESLLDENIKKGWSVNDEPYFLSEREKADEAREWLYKADVLLSGHRALSVFDERFAQGKKTFYFSERWFKPIFIKFPGWFRLLYPSYLKMARNFVAWAQRDAQARIFAAGPWAKKDFLRMGIPVDKIVDWGYFVESSKIEKPIRQAIGPNQRRVLRVLWVGRMLALKRVDTLVKAVGVCLEKFPIELTLVGDGPERNRLEALASKVLKRHSGAIHFRHSVLIQQVRGLMHEHDVYVFPSNGYEGWGAVVNEALEEGMDVIGTYECGACPTLLSRDRLFHSGEVKALVRLLEKEWKGELSSCSIDGWTAKDAADRFLRICKGECKS